jgi:hypothetical protein
MQKIYQTVSAYFQDNDADELTKDNRETMENFIKQSKSGFQMNAMKAIA